MVRLRQRKKIVLGGLLTAVIVIGLLFAATQYIAYVFGYQAALGDPVYSDGGTSLYWPWQSLIWAMNFGGLYPAPFKRAFGGIALVVFLSVMLVVGIRRKKKRVPAFGADQWGTRQDAEAAGLFARAGVVAGCFGSDLMIYDGPEHHLVSGASRSGKGVGHVIPTLLSWPKSALVYDIKNELYAETGGYRSTFTDVLKFNPTDPESAHFNPLLEVRKGADEIRDVQNIVEILADPSGYKDQQTIWDGNAKQFLVALILHVLYTADDDAKHLGTVRDALLDFDAALNAMLTTAHRVGADGEGEVHPEIRRIALSMTNKSERFRSSVQGTAEDYLTLYADPVIIANTATSDFCIGDLMCATNPVTLYIQPPPSDEARVRPLIRLLVNQMSRALMERKDRDGRGRAKRHKLLLVLDEFPTLGRLDFFQTNMGQMAGYGMKALIIVQSFNHIERTYGANNVIIDNCHVLVAFASADTRTQERISRMTGEALEYRESYSRPRSIFSQGHPSVSVSEKMERLMQPGGVREMPPDQQLVFVTGYPPFRTLKLRFFEHEPLLALTRMPAPTDTPAHLRAGALADWAGVRGHGSVASVAEVATDPNNEAEAEGSLNVSAEAELDDGSGDPYTI